MIHCSNEYSIFSFIKILNKLTFVTKIQVYTALSAIDNYIREN